MVACAISKYSFPTSSSLYAMEHSMVSPTHIMTHPSQDGIPDGNSVMEGASEREGDTDGMVVCDGSSDMDGILDGRLVVDGACEFEGSNDVVGTDDGLLELSVGLMD
jgi:hypothetical protein